MASVLNFGAVRVHLGEKSGKYPDGNQLIVQGMMASKFLATFEEWVRVLTK